MIGIIGAMETEVEILRAAMENSKKETVANFEFFTGKLSGKDVVLLRCGIGKVHAAVGCAMLIAIYKPAYIINTGTAGGINPAGCAPLSFGDAVISNGLVYHDVDVTVFGYAPGQVPGCPSAIFPVDEHLIKASQDAVSALQKENILPHDFKAIPGLICSGDVFMADSKKVIALSKTFSALRAVDMESTAIAHTCVIFSVPYIVVRCISDIAGEESPITHDEYVPVASKHSSSIVMRLIKNYCI
jgi:adenosylhomocysteine nucleosidase